MLYKLFIYCPDDPAVIDRIIEAAAKAGAGVIGPYTHCAFLVRGEGNWKALEGSRPTVGTVGQMTRAPEVKIEMRCSGEALTAAIAAIRAAHPYEEPAIEAVPLKEP